LVFDYNSGLSGEQIIKKRGISKGVLYKHLSNNGLRLENKQNKVKFNQHIFDCIDTEEKAY
jgi:hypothetical protein